MFLSIVPAIRLVRFRGTFDESSNLFAKFTFYLVECNFRILYRVVEKSGNNDFL